ncbi:hypothetical protein J2Y45_002798 [Dyadobacter sp. BE34]|uniref:Zinc-finger domain-containing protein n=1 Tax=Dyadobacter fermentans TaxID=94254 RepID=A0ABU1QW83_9BACT|nr:MULTISPECIES: hypothetical protein [Dyadobacter]MDR6804894.1 hypothetical protein [Dyadobacter fermentans]MDR7043347.1 hypothetical protein [Dyadobacter sp. BE242]MDR7197659.1 hypothetical protein [Dyadobacter sp. BE34]MDR7214908.1 hypothetical protein [Dyadobacter sp. BE31]MDR7262443.1 hypothetical protein [Dyadobacter sp. BE32]
MNIADHLSDIEIQQHALDAGNSGMAAATHIAQCPHCSGRVAFYQKMARGMSVVPMEEFDFNLTKTVLAQLPARKRSHAPERAFIACVSLVGVFAAIGVFCYLNTGLLNDLLGKSDVISYGTACCLLFAFLLTNLWSENVGKIRRINLPESLQHFPGAAV